MALDNVNPITNDYNKNAEVEVQKKAEQELVVKAKSYNLNKQEMTQAKTVLADKHRSLKKEHDGFFNNPDEYKKRLNQEIKNIRAKDKPTPQLNMLKTPKLSKIQIANIAKNNIRAEHLSKMNAIEKKGNEQLNHILDNARNDGRGPQQPTQDQTRNNDWTLTQEFNRNR